VFVGCLPSDAMRRAGSSFNIVEHVLYVIVCLVCAYHAVCGPLCIPALIFVNLYRPAAGILAAVVTSIRISTSATRQRGNGTTEESMLLVQPTAQHAGICSQLVAYSIEYREAVLAVKLTTKLAYMLACIRPAGVGNLVGVRMHACYQHMPWQCIPCSDIMW
jgi:hypothetical protein